MLCSKFSDQKKLIILKLLFTLMYIGPLQMASSVSIVPNTSDVHAIVKNTTPIDEEDVANVTLYIISAKDYKSMPNFMKDNVDKNITVIVSKDDLNFFKGEVNVLVSVFGDEKGQFNVAKPK
jgi:hypothetical protein